MNDADAPELPVVAIAPYKTIYPRLAPCVLNTEERVLRCVKALAEMRP